MSDDTRIARKFRMNNTVKLRYNIHLDPVPWVYVISKFDCITDQKRSSTKTVLTDSEQRFQFDLVEYLSLERHH